MWSSRPHYPFHVFPGSGRFPSPHASSPLFLGTAYSTFTFYLNIGLLLPCSQNTRIYFFPPSCPRAPTSHPRSRGLVTTLIALGAPYLPSIIVSLDVFPLVSGSPSPMAAFFPALKTLPLPPPPHILGLPVAYAPLPQRYSPIEFVGFQAGVEPDFVVFPALGVENDLFRTSLKAEKIYPLWILFPSACKSRCEVNGDGEKALV